ncbi:MAG: alcohol dehydrogenase catalytic domain-containing protein, partial [Dehalococcoidia bacterium]|nr:alcohol dehydrogenase catalytic domain-containing protein [Dehalococcoidia bacterium]
MRAVVFDGQLRLDDAYPAPQAEGDEVVIRVRLAGVCNTDLEISRGYMGFHGVLGHEFVGEVVAAPSDPSLVGARVVGEINAHCATCPGCAAATRHHCPGRTVLGILGRDGAMAEYVRLPRANLHRLPERVPDEAAVFVEPLAAAFSVLESAHVRPSDAVLVLGDGKLGQ